MDYAYHSYDDAIRSGSLTWPEIIALNGSIGGGRGPLLATGSAVQFQLGTGERLLGHVTACDLDSTPRYYRGGGQVLGKAGEGRLTIAMLITSPLPERT